MVGTSCFARKRRAWDRSFLSCAPFVDLRWDFEAEADATFAVDLDAWAQAAQWFVGVPVSFVEANFQKLFAGESTALTAGVSRFNMDLQRVKVTERRGGNRKFVFVVLSVLQGLRSVASKRMSSRLQQTICWRPSFSTWWSLC